MTRAALLSTMVVALSPGMAAAATVSVQGATILYQAAPGESNRLVVSIPRNQTDLRFRDASGIAVVAGSGCSPVGAQAACSAGAGQARILLDDGDDSFSSGPFYATAPALTIDLGPGNDRGGTQSLNANGHTMAGGAGDDLLGGTKDVDRLDGGPGNDTINGESGVDVLIGGPGSDAFAAGDHRADRVFCDEEDLFAPGTWEQSFDPFDRITGCSRPYDPAGPAGCPISTTAPRTQEVAHTFLIRLWAREDCRARVSAKVGAGGARFQLRPVAVRLSREQTKRLRIRLPARVRARLRAALTSGRPAAVRVKVVARDQGGQTTRDGVRIAFRR